MNMDKDEYCVIDNKVAINFFNYELENGGLLPKTNSIVTEAGNLKNSKDLRYLGGYRCYLVSKPAITYLIEINEHNNTCFIKALPTELVIKGDDVQKANYLYNNSAYMRPAYDDENNEYYLDNDMVDDQMSQYIYEAEGGLN